MIPIENFIYDALRKVEKMKIYNCLDIRTFKRDRSVLIEKVEEGYNVIEDGFFKEEYLAISKEELRKILKLMEKREFPRSNIVRFTILENRNCKKN